MRWELAASKKRGIPPRKNPAAAGRGRNGMKKTIGIVGGMGPLATADLLEKMIRSADTFIRRRKVGEILRLKFSAIRFIQKQKRFIWIKNTLNFLN